MAKKMLKKKTQRKAAAKSAAAPVMDSAREIWLAGLGALNVAQQEGSRILEEGSKIFDKLVAEGSKMENKARKDVEGAMDNLRGEVENRMQGMRKQADAVRKQAADNWDRLEKIFEDRVARSLASLGIPSREDVNNLAAKVQLLSRQVAELDAKTGAAKAPAARRTAAKKATGKAARKTTRKKAIRRKTAGKAGSVAAKPAGGAG
jgi:poly(hydroxyalkanoate) granule-associated protein